MADSMMPDLTGLSEEERKIIEEVLARQKAEEQKEEQLTKGADQELEDIDRQLSQRKEAASKLIGTQDDATCQICQKTKFVGGIGHKCFYCQLRSCARCGGRTTSKNKSIWACSLCQRRQQILAKTGKWFQNATDPKPNSRPNSQQDLASEINGHMSINSGMPNGHVIQQEMQQQRQQMPQIMVQQPVQQSSQQQFQQQSSQQFQQAIPQQFQQTPQQQFQQPLQQQPQQQKESVVGGLMGMIGLKSSNQQQQSQNVLQQPAQPIAPINGQGNGFQQQQMLNQQNVTRRQNTLLRQSSLENSEFKNGNGPRRQSTKYDDHFREPETSQKRSFDDRKKPDSYMDSSRESQKNEYYDERRRSDQKRREGQQIYEDDPSFKKEGKRSRDEQRPPHIDRPIIENQQIRKMSQIQQKKSLKEKQIDIQQIQQIQSIIPPVVPPPEKIIGFSTPTILKPLPGNKHRKKLQCRLSLKEGTSSDEEIPQGNTESSEKNDFTEKDLLLYIYGAQKKMGAEMAKFDASLKSKSNLDLTISAKSSILPGDTVAAKIRRYLASPVSWQPSTDQKHLIGHMILQRLKNDSGDLGLKVAGGRTTIQGKLGTFVTKVRPGSVADIVGQLRPGDEVLEWNGHNLQNASVEHVRTIVSSSKNDPQIELIVSRNLAAGSDDLNLRRSATGLGDYSDYTFSKIEIDPITGIRQTPTIEMDSISSIFRMGYKIPRPRHTSVGPMRQKYSMPDIPFSANTMIGQHSPSTMVTTNAPISRFTPHIQIFGKIEISLLYLPQERELIVTILGASDLSPRRDGNLRNPYAKLFLLPDRSERSLRQTTIHAETLAPIWNECFYYRNLTEPILMSRVLEVTVWDYDKYEANSFLGEVLIDFSTTLLDNQPFCYDLVEMDDDNPVRMRLRNQRRFSSITPPPRSYSEMAHHQHEIGYRNAREPLRYHVNDEYEYDEMGYPRIPRSKTYDRTGPVIGGATGNSCPCGATTDWNINSQNGYMNDQAFNQVGGYYRRPHSATPMTREEEMAQIPRYPRPRARTRHSQDPSYRPMSPLQSPYGPEDLPPRPTNHPKSEKPPIGRRYNQEQQQPSLDQMMQQQQQQQQQQQIPSLPPHMQTYNGEYGSDGSETMSINSAQSMQNRQFRQQLPPSSEDGECSSNSLKHQNFINDDYGQNQSMEETGNQSDSATTKTNAQTLKEMKERKKSLMTRFIPGKGPSEGKRTGFARSEEVGVPESLLNPSERFTSTTQFQKQTSKESTDSDKKSRSGTNRRSPSFGITNSRGN